MKFMDKVTPVEERTEPSNKGKDNFICQTSVIWCDGRKNGACKDCRQHKCSKCLNRWSYFKEECEDCVLNKEN